MEKSAKSVASVQPSQNDKEHNELVQNIRKRRWMTIEEARRTIQPSVDEEMLEDQREFGRWFMKASPEERKEKIIGTRDD